VEVGREEKSILERAAKSMDDVMVEMRLGVEEGSSYVERICLGWREGRRTT